MTYKKIINAIKKTKSVLVTAHVNPDPDSICSSLAMAQFLRSKGKRVTIVNEDAIARRYQFIPGASSIKRLGSIRNKKFDAIVILDCGELDRIGKVKQFIDENTVVINIDHHVTNESFGNVNAVDPKASSTAEMLYNLFKTARFKIKKTTALYLYAGIMTDTGCFRYANTTPTTHHIAAELCRFDIKPDKLYQKFYDSVPLKDIKEFSKVVSNFQEYYRKKVVIVELNDQTIKKFSKNFDLRDSIFKFLRCIQEVEVFAIITAIGKNSSRVNFRSSGKINVAKLAQDFGGGGHHNASGCEIAGNMSHAKKKIIARLKGRF